MSILNHGYVYFPLGELISDLRGQNITGGLKQNSLTLHKIGTCKYTRTIEDHIQGGGVIVEKLGTLFEVF